RKRRCPGLALPQGWIQADTGFLTLYIVIPALIFLMFLSCGHKKAQRANSLFHLIQQKHFSKKRPNWDIQQRLSGGLLCSRPAPACPSMYCQDSARPIFEVSWA